MQTSRWEDRIRFRYPGRQIGPDENATREPDVHVWQEALNVLACRTYELAGGRATVTIDWSSFGEAILKERYDDTVNVVSRVVLTSDTHAATLDYTHLALHEAFFCINLAVPGAFTFGSAEISTERRRSAPFRAVGVPFEEAWISSLNLKWPHIAPLPLHSVVRWFDAIGLGVRQVAKTRVEKAIFTILHIAKDEVDEPAAILWIAQALESLYDVPSALSKASLVRRLAPTLHLNDSRRKWLSKQLTEFYGARGAIVHGGAPVVHPIRQDVWDREVDIASLKLMDLSSFGLSLVLATLQEHVRHGWRELRFSETLEPRAFD